jgi:hypothetical protein
MPGHAASQTSGVARNIPLSPGKTRTSLCPQEDLSGSLEQYVWYPVCSHDLYRSRCSLEDRS